MGMKKLSLDGWVLWQMLSSEHKEITNEITHLLKGLTVQEAKNILSLTNEILKCAVIK